MKKNFKKAKLMSSTLRTVSARLVYSPARFVQLTQTSSCREFKNHTFNTKDKILEEQVQLDNIKHYRPLLRPVVKDTSLRVQILVKELHQQNYIDDMTNKWLCLTPNPPCAPVLYTLTKYTNQLWRPQISGCDSSTERLSSFLGRLLQPTAQKQKSYLKDTTAFINLMEITKVPKNAILVATVS